MKIKIQKLHENAVTPTYAHAGDACFDLTAATVEGYSKIPISLSEGCSVTSIDFINNNRTDARFMASVIGIRF